MAAGGSRITGSRGCFPGNGAGSNADGIMIEYSRPETTPEFHRFMQIALDKNSERNMRLAAEALISAILNGATEISAEAVEILIEENEYRAAENVARIVSGKCFKN